MVSWAGSRTGFGTSRSKRTLRLPQSLYGQHAGGSDGAGDTPGKRTVSSNQQSLLPECRHLGRRCGAHTPCALILTSYSYATLTVISQTADGSGANLTGSSSLLARR